MRLSTLAIVTTFAACGLTITSCGDETAAPGAPTIAKAQLVARGDAICRHNLERYPGEPVQFDLEHLRAEDLARFARSFRNGSRAIAASVREVRALGTPDRDSDQLRELLSEGTAAADAYSAMARTASSGDIEGFKQAFAELEDNRAPELAKRFGFSVCAQ